MMTKQELFDAFDGFLSMTNIVERYGEMQVVGKYCVIAPEDDIWDIWLCNPKNISEGLGMGRINNIISLFPTSSCVWRKLTREADTKIALKDLKPVIVGNHARFGLKKRQVYSDAVMQGKRDSLRQINEQRSKTGEQA